MDARKAFDVLCHLGLLREMNKAGFERDSWRFFLNWCTDLTSKIKWNGLAAITHNCRKTGCASRRNLVTLRL